MLPFVCSRIRRGVLKQGNGRSLRRSKKSESQRPGAKGQSHGLSQLQVQVFRVTVTLASCRAAAACRARDLQNRSKEHPTDLSEAQATERLGPTRPERQRNTRLRLRLGARWTNQGPCYGLQAFSPQWVWRVKLTKNSSVILQVYICPHRDIGVFGSIATSHRLEGFSGMYACYGQTLL